VSVGIDQLSHGSGGDGRPRCRDEQETAVLSKTVAGHRLDSDRGPIELEIHLATADKADSIPEHARDDQSTRLVNGGAHAINTTMVMGARHARGKAALRPLLDKARHRDIT
jgi:hypothetical protein